jgi:flavin-binding protein dodecin
MRALGPRSGARRFVIAAGADWRDYRFSFEETERDMAESVYKIIELVGTSTESWEKAANAAIQRASKSLRDLRVAEVTQLDMTMDNGKVKAYRAKVKVSFKFDGK